MLYLSKVLGAAVLDSADKTVGILKDVLIKYTPGAYSPLESLVIKTREKKYRHIPFHYVENLSADEITLKTLTEKIIAYQPEKSDILLLRDVMDQQIVDTGGARVVRVNDLELGEIDGQMCVAGIDISTRGLLRRLGINHVFPFNLFKVNLIDWIKVQPVKGSLKLETLSKDLVKLHPADLANIIEDLNIKKSGELIRALDSETAAKILEETKPRVRQILLRVLGAEKAAKISERMSIDEFVDLVKLLPYHEAKEICEYVQNGRKEQVKKLLQYPNDTAGGLMTTEFISARPGMKVAEVIEEIKRVSDSFRSILYVYVTDAEGVYKGVVSLRRLLTAKPADLVEKIMKKSKRLPCARLHYTVPEMAKIMTKYDLNSMAVLDKKNRLQGIVTVDDIMRKLIPQA